MRRIITHIVLLVIVCAGALCRAESHLIVPRGEELWINYPAETTQQEPKKSTVHNYQFAACKALHEHKKNSAHTKEWRLKYDELHAQCAMETIEESIKRLQMQLEKDRLRLEKAKREQEKERQK